LKVYKGSVSKAGLESLGEHELGFFIQACAMLNEINILHKATLFSNKELKTDAERKAQNSQSLFLLTLLSGKLWEGWDLVEKAYFGAKLSKTYHGLLPPEAIDSLESPKAYFKRSDNLVKTVRDKIAFHYDSSEILDQFSKTAKDETFEIYLSKSQGNCFYFFHHVLLLNAILERTGISNPMEATDAYFSDVLTTAKWFIEFLSSCIVAITKNNIEWKWEEIEIPNPISLEEVVLPYFVTESSKKG
jgi:hypothetical protein